MNEVFKYRLQKFAQTHKDKLLVSLFTLIGVVIIATERSQPSDGVPQAEQPLAIDTLIPQGYNLVPIEIENSVQLNGLMLDHSLVDLYQAPESKSAKAILVGKSLKLLRAPYNPEVFALLIRDSEQARLMSFPGPFRVIIQNRQQSDHHIVEKKVNTKPTIEFQN